jgi:hypothetical protein
MAWRDIDRFHAVSGAKDEPNLLSTEDKWFTETFFQGHVFVFATEPAFGASYGGYPEAQPEMSGKSQFFGVGDSLAVTEQDSRLLPDFPVCLD